MQDLIGIEEMKMDLTKNPEWNKVVLLTLGRVGEICVERICAQLPLSLRFHALEMLTLPSCRNSGR